MNKKNQQEAFVWPEFNSDSARIKAYTKRYKDVSLTEAFEQAYNLKISNVSEHVNSVPSELTVGEIIKLKVFSISKENVVFDSANYKEHIRSAVNLHKYKRFKENLPYKPITLQVVDVNKDRVVVDPIMPLLNGYLSPILKDMTLQKVIGNPRSVRVKNLQLMKGGFVGQAVIPNVSEFVGEDYTVEVFIPGSQIVLNITDDFEQFVGKDVDVFIINHMTKPGSNSLSLIASAKELIKFKGECKLIELFNSWCEEGELWKNFETQTLQGTVTGVINSSKKCGVFVELPSLSMTGLVSVDAAELVNYKAGSEVEVKLTGFDEEKKFNPYTKQNEHVEPYIIEEGRLVRCNLKPVLEFV